MPEETAADARPLQVLISVRPFRGHLHPLIPLARAFQRAGHRVAVASAEDVASVLGSAGLVWLPAGVNPRDLWQMSPDEDPDYSYVAVKPKLDDLLEVAVGQFWPDIVIREPTDLAPALLAEITRAYSVTYGVAYFIPRQSWHILGADKTVETLRREFSLPEDPELNCLFRDLYLSVLPPEFELVKELPVPAVLPTRYVPWDSDLKPPAKRPRAPGDRPRVLMTLGTIYNTDLDLFNRFLEAVSGQPYDVVCTLGESGDAAVLADAPSNVAFERYLPHSSVLPSCQAMLCHGGFNTMMGALCEGVPLVIVPLGSDQMFNAKRCVENGVGLALSFEEATPTAIREAVRRVIEEPSFAKKAKAVRQMLNNQPGLAEVVDRMAALARSRRSVSGSTVSRGGGDFED